MHLPIGVIVNSLSVLFGGLVGALLGKKVPERLRIALPLTFGLASMAMGINYTVKLATLPAVVLSLILGSIIGESCKLEKGIEYCATIVRKPISRLFNDSGSIQDPKEFMEKFVGIVVLFCASGTGIFGAFTEGMTGDHSVLFTKSLLDFFTAAIFATALGYIVMTIFVPQVLILILLFFSASFIVPLTDAHMIADFTAVGGIIMLATGFRICGIKAFPVANMLPALVLVMPISHLWSVLMG
ncbi:DUF554 domain-containing protein [Paenibacillus pinistramenti]|uniref:DUF554 domain-containing protein n=1 Tax=Paenibacillus pinistramenti TaxID=1768003 RepID=UPI001107F13B|nr:DUF554 domain-containing protein [Paenibacillus pinistramenti]